MSTYTDRCAAVTAALQDLARDLEADLGKLVRWRGVTEDTPGLFDSPARFRDPGSDLDTYTAQKVANPARGDLTRSRVLASYRGAAQLGKAMVYANSPEGDDLAARTAVFELVGAIQAVSDYDEARALVASFSVGV